VVEAGLRTGRLPAALEALAGSIRRVAETRRGVAAAAFYPLLVLVLAWGFFAFFAVKIAPGLLLGFDRIDAAGSRLVGWLAHCGRWAVYWGPAVPLIIALLACLWWYRSSRAMVAQPAWACRLLGWLPWMGRTLRWSRTATFSEVLALLVENRVPLDEALVLAGEASGDPRMSRAAAKLAEAVGRGEVPNRRGLDSAAFPPLLSWLMAAGHRQGAMLRALKHAAETYHRRARHQAELARVFLPVVLTVAIGGSVTLLYALTLFVPYTSMLRALGGP
jgi:type II secretory pathway component PulF